jgi:hypothetical protein
MDNQPSDSEQESRFLGEKNSEERNRSRDGGATKSPVPRAPKQREKDLSEKSGRKRTDLWSQAYSKVQQENPKLLVAFKKCLLSAKSTPLLRRREISFVLKWLSNCLLVYKTKKKYYSRLRNFNGQCCLDT